MPKPLRRTDKEEFWNCLTHALGFVASVIGAAILILEYCRRPTPIVASVSLFSISLILVYSTSALSHYFRSEKLLSLFRRLDQACIYLLIVSSYSPFSIKYLGGFYWNAVLAGMWLFAIVGFISKLFFAHRVESVSIWIYLLLGWTPLFSGMPFVGLVPTTAVWMIILGGLFYSGGTWFLAQDKKVWYYHAIWHIFVIAGSLTHFLAVFWYV